MPTKPKIKTLSNSSVDIMNAIRNSASTNYRDYVPIATQDASSVRTIGAIIMDNPQLQNEFLSALVNRIARVLVTSRMFDNPLRMFKKGFLEFGETVEEIFVNISKAHTFDPEVAEQKVWAREIPDVRSAFHVMNYQKFYKQTISDDQLRQAFLSWDGVTDLISKIVEAIYTASNYDEFLVTKYLLAKNILNGRIKATQIPAINATNMKSIVSTVKETMNNLTFLNNEFNVAGVMNSTPITEQYIILNTKFDAVMDVEVLASAFNMDKATFMGQRLVIDGFGNLDMTRLNELFADDEWFTPITQEECDALNSIPAVVVSSDYFMIFDNTQKFTELYNGEGMYWNYWYHVWKTFSVSPFAQASLFIADNVAITSVTVSPKEATVIAGQSIQMTAKVETEGFDSQVVVWSVDDPTKASINATGLLEVDAKANKGDTITITATSIADSTKSDTATITVA